MHRLLLSLALPLALLPLTACLVSDPDPEGVITCSPESDQVYPDLGEGVDYLLEAGCSNWSIRGVTVTLEPGVVVQIPDGAYVSVDYDGALVAQGSAELPIGFVGSADQASWQGIQITSANLETSFEHLEISGAGSATMIYLDEPTSLAIWGDGRANVSHLSVVHGGGHGLSVLSDNAHQPGHFGPGLSFTDLPGYPVLTEGHHLMDFELHDIALSSVGEELISVYIANSNRDLEQDAVWGDIPLPLLFTSDLTVEQSLTLEAGMELRFVAGQGLRTVSYGGPEGALTIAGTVDNPVLLRGELEAPGAWAGVLISTDTPANRIEHAEIRNAGAYEWTWAGVGANLTLGYGETSLTVNDLLLSGSSDAGLLLDNDLGEVTLTQTNLRFADNAGGDTVDVRD